MRRVEIFFRQNPLLKLRVPVKRKYEFIRRIQIMQTTKLKKTLSIILCIMLIAATALFTTGCGDNKQELKTATFQEGAVLGEGETEFFFIVTDLEGKETSCTIHTDKTIVGDALLELNLIAGDAGDYGMYVKMVNGVHADYDIHGKYWAFYADGAYANSGVDTTEIVDGVTYSFKAE